MFLYYMVLFILGAIIGSFLNVYVHRSLDGRNWVSGRSECDSCHHKLQWFELIPVLSYTCQGGKCRYCGEKISPIHFISELMVGSIFVFFATEPAALILMLVLWINTMSDLSAHSTLTASIYIGAVAIMLLTGGEHIMVFGIGLILLMIANKSKHLEEKIGFGDLDIIWLIAVYGGLFKAAVAVAIGCTLGCIISIVYFKIKGTLSKEIGVPMVPFLYIGTTIAILLGGSLCLFWNGSFPNLLF